jgi:hypothetical protein
MQNYFLHKTIASIFVTLSFAVAQTQANVAARFEWSGPDETVITGVLIGLGVLLLTLIATSVVQNYNKKKVIGEFADKQFDQRARNAGLSATEQALLRRMVASVAPDMPVYVFTSLMIFENAVDFEINKVIKIYGDDSPKALTIAEDIFYIRRKLGFQNIEERALESTRNIEFGQEISLHKPSDGVLVGQTKLIANNELFMEFDISLLENFKRDRNDNTLVAKIVRRQDATYVAPLTIRSVNVADGTLSFYHTTTLERQQARQYARIPVDIPIQCKIISRAGDKAEPAVGEILQDTALVDISGGGLAFTSPVSLSTQDIVLLAFTLQQNKFTMKGKIVAISAQEDKQNVFYKHGVIFFNALENDIERIVKFIYEKQREKMAYR